MGSARGRGVTAAAAAAPSDPLDRALSTGRGGGVFPAAAAVAGTRRKRAVSDRAANALGERNTTLLRACVLAIGAARSRRLLAETIATQKRGGMLTADGSRRRSGGGVFFELLKHEMEPKDYRKLMADDKKRKQSNFKKRNRTNHAQKDTHIDQSEQPLDGALAAKRHCA